MLNCELKQVNEWELVATASARSFRSMAMLYQERPVAGLSQEPPGRGLQGAKSDYEDIARALSDARFDIDEMFGADDRVVVRWNLHATHTGPFAGVPPTQKKIAVRGISLYRLCDGRITETRNLADLLALFEAPREFLLQVAGKNPTPDEVAAGFTQMNQR